MNTHRIRQIKANPMRTKPKAPPKTIFVHMKKESLIESKEKIRSTQFGSMNHRRSRFDHRNPTDVVDDQQRSIDDRKYSSRIFKRDFSWKVFMILTEY